MTPPSSRFKNGKCGADLRAIKDVRDWISLLKSEGEFHEVSAKVDWNIELATIARHCQSAPNGPALLFSNIKDHENSWCRKLFTNSVASYGRMAMAFGLTGDIGKRDMVIAIKNAYRKRLKSAEVSTAPLKRNVLKG